MLMLMLMLLVHVLCMRMCCTCVVLCMSCANDAYELRMPCAYMHTLGPAMVQHTFSARGVRAGGRLARAPPSSAAARRCSAPARECVAGGKIDKKFILKNFIWQPSYMI